MKTFSTQNIQNLLAYPFKDPRWKQKLGLLALASLASLFIPLIAWIFPMGYLARIIRDARNRRDLPDRLPEWDDFNQLAVDGARLLGVSLIYGLPLFVIFGVGYATMMGTTMAPIFADYEANPGVALLPMLGMVLYFAMFGVGFVFTMLWGLVSPIVMAHTVIQRKFSAGFAWGALWRLFKANWLGFVALLVVVYGITYLAVFVIQIIVLTIVLLCLYPFALGLFMVYVSPITGVLMGSAYREAEEKLGAAAVFPAPVEATPAQEDPELS